MTAQTGTFAHDSRCRPGLLASPKFGTNGGGCPRRRCAGHAGPACNHRPNTRAWGNHLFRTAICLGLVTALACTSCNRPAAASTDAAQPRVEKVSHSPVELVLTVEPGRVNLDQDVFLNIRVTAPASVRVNLPPVDDRVTGFLFNGLIDQPPAVGNDGATVTERRVRLTPLVAPEYRIAPMAISYEDASVSPPVKGWFPTPPVRLDMSAPGNGGAVQADLTPYNIPPSARTVALWIAMALLLLLLVLGVLRLVKRLHREAVLRRLSPRERALRELDELLSQRLLEKERIKDFYLELTMIVRRYVERQHGVRAPEQTTEEFLASISRNPTFPAETTGRLKEFLESADLVKFAAFEPRPAATEAMIRTARAYLESDKGGPVAPGSKD